MTQNLWPSGEKATIKKTNTANVSHSASVKSYLAGLLTQMTKCWVGFYPKNWKVWAWWEFLWFSDENFYDFLMKISMIFWWEFLWFSVENVYMIFWWDFLWYSDGFWNLIYFSITSHRVSVERNVKWFNEGRNTAWMSLEIVHKYN